MKKIVLLLITTLSLASYNPQVEAAPNTEVIPQNQSPSIMELAFIRSIGSTILEIMAMHGDNQLFTSSRIEKITRDVQNDTYDVTLRVIGFEGPLNPPFKLIRITIRFPGNYTNYKVISYSHKYITDIEANEYSKNTGY